MSQLIFVVEACSTSRSDYLYIKSVLDHFYDSSEHKFSPIYAGSKTRLVDQGKKIEECSRRAPTKENRSFFVRITTTKAIPPTKPSKSTLKPMLSIMGLNSL